MKEINEIGQELLNYCNKFKVPVEHIFEILNDQKVVPMIRGKATEYNVFNILKNLLNSNEWSVDKLNLNPNPNTYDEDISITHKRTGTIVKAECKNAVRGSMKHSLKASIKEIHCTIKCHKSRSNTKKLDTGNDKYLVDDFDLIISNISNSIIKGASLDDNFELIDNKYDIIDKLSKHYNTSKDFQSLFDATSNDWRFVVTEDIGKNGFIPRTPTLQLVNDLSWKIIDYIEESLFEIVKGKMQNRKQKSRRNN